MRLSAALRSAATAVTALVVLIASPGTAHAAQWQSYAGDFPDPSVLAVTESGTTAYYAYSTQVWDSSAGRWRNVPVVRSTDLTSWSTSKDALPKLGKWARTGNTWAPAVTRMGSRYVLHYTATHRSSGRQCIGVATSSSPTGPFSDTRSTPLVCQTTLGGSIDAETFRAPGGQWYLHWKSDENAIGGRSRIWAQPLSADGLQLTGSATAVLTHDQAWEEPLVEGPQMVLVDGQHYLFYGAGWWEDTTAGIGYARCHSATGPCTKVTTGSGWLLGDAQHVGPAGPSFFQRGGQWVVAHHGWAPDKVGYSVGGKRSLWLTDVTFASTSPVLVR